LLPLVLMASHADAAQHAKQKSRQRATHKAPAAVAQAPDMQMIATQVMLDRAGYSPGEIDAKRGTSTDRALTAFTTNGGNAQALPSDALTSYTITEQDAAGPFAGAIPSDLMAMSKLPSLGYATLVEALGERFHSSPDLLKRLNPEARFAAGESIKVPNVAAAVAPVGPSAGRQNDPNSAAVTTVTVRKSSSD